MEINWFCSVELFDDRVDKIRGTKNTLHSPSCTTPSHPQHMFPRRGACRFMTWERWKKTIGVLTRIPNPRHMWIKPNALQIYSTSWFNAARKHPIFIHTPHYEWIQWNRTKKTFKKLCILYFIPMKKNIYKYNKRLNLLEMHKKIIWNTTCYKCNNILTIWYSITRVH